MKIIFTLLFVSLIILFTTCSKSNSNSNSVKSDTIPLCDSLTLVKSPLDVPWVQQVISGRDCNYIYQGSKLSTCIYKERLVVYFENPLSSQGTCVGKLYNCNGTILLNGMSGPEWFNLDQNIQNKKVFWTKP